MKKILILLTSFLLLFTACEDNYLDRLPKDQLTEKTAFITNSNFETFSWGFYSWFDGYNLGPLDLDFASDVFVSSNWSQGSSWLWNRMLVPASSDSWTNNYARIKRANLMLGHIETSSMSDTDKKHWKGVGLFFRSFSYCDLLNKFGDVSWIDKVLSDGDTDILFASQTSRDEVATNVLNDLLEAEEAIKADGNGKNTINKNVVRALISRFGLAEGTWRKYHGLSDANKYLEASVAASTKLITAFPTLMANYDLVFNSEDLANQPGIILYKHYDGSELVSVLPSRMRNSAGNWDLTKSAVNLYLCTDGQSRWTSPLFDGEDNMYDEFRNRDHRLYYTVVPPYKIKRIGGNNTFKWEYTDVPREREYMDLLGSITDEKHKQLPDKNWRGFVVAEVPHFRTFNNGQGYNVSITGYKLFKYFNQLNTGIQNKDFSDAPIFRMGEILVNHAEASFELGQFTQEVADQTINKLRDRAHVAHLNLGTMVADPTRDASVDPVLWEIRRERTVELMAEGFRFNDLRRWKKMGDYAAKEKLGMKIKASDYNNKLPIQNGADEGYISPFGAPPAFPDYYYLYPVPKEELVINENLKQNPGWEDEE